MANNSIVCNTFRLQVELNTLELGVYDEGVQGFKPCQSPMGRNNPNFQNLLQIVFGNPTADHLKGGGSAELLEDDAHNLRVLTNE